MTLTVASALWALAAAGPLVAQQPHAARYPRSLFDRVTHVAPVVVTVDVPFVPQGELLCGGAAAAMVLRYHGERGASAESFTHLVRRDEGGIRTDELTAELDARGWDVEVRVNDLAGLEAAIAAGIPPIVLLESAAGRWHYVVVVGLERDQTANADAERSVIVHDPARAPDVRLGEDAFLRSWEAGGRWMLLVRPRTGVAPAPIRLAEPAGTEPASPALLRASERFRARDWSAAAAAAETAARAAPTDARAWRLLGGALYLEDRRDDALDAWARVDEPRIDGVDVTGLVRTRHPVVHQLLGLHPGERLERTGLERARRRAALLPTAAVTRVGYRAEPGGWAEVETVVLEGPAHPFTRSGALVLGLGAASGELTAWESGLAGAGERLEARWRPGEDGGVRMELAAPSAFGPSGRTEVGAARLDSRHLAAWLRTTDWATGWLRWEAGLRADRADGARVRPGVTAALHGSSGSALDARAGAAAWVGEGTGALGAFDLSLVLGGPADGWSAELRGGLRAVTGTAPRDLRPGAGSDGRRALAAPFSGPDPMPLLRGHSTVHAESVAHAGVQATRWAGSAVRVGAAAFADAAIVRTGPVTERLVDVGLGVRARLAELPGALRVDHAWALSSDARRWSFGWELPAGARLAP